LALSSPFGSEGQRIPSLRKNCTWFLSLVESCLQFRLRTCPFITIFRAARAADKGAPRKQSTGSWYCHCCTVTFEANRRAALCLECIDYLLIVDRTAKARGERLPQRGIPAEHQFLRYGRGTVSLNHAEAKARVPSNEIMGGILVGQSMWN